jgi:hypothetical protein
MEANRRAPAALSYNRPKIIASDEMMLASAEILSDSRQSLA